MLMIDIGGGGFSFMRQSGQYSRRVTSGLPFLIKPDYDDVIESDVK
jgi:hypothetical protein